MQTIDTDGTPLSGLTQGTVIRNSAHIVFDWNEEIPTDTWKM